MTHYDKLIDAITDQLYDSFKQEEWNQHVATDRAHKILTIVEEFQSTRTKLNQWRASD